MIALLIYTFLFFSGPVESQECSCQYQLLDNSNIGNYIEETNPFFKKINSSNLKYPELETGCSATISCADESSLFIFDSTGLGKLFGNTSANATCVSPTNTWNINTGNGAEDPTSFEQLWGTCLVAEPCNCTAIAINSTNMVNYVEPRNPFHAILTSSDIRPPVLTKKGCSGTISCEGDYTLLVFDSTGLGKTGFNEEYAIGICDSKTQKWKVNTGSRMRTTTFKELFGVCVPNVSLSSQPPTASTNATSSTSPSTSPCSPGAPSTFLFAYSNILFMNATDPGWKLFENYNGEYATFGRVRFDLNWVEPIEYFTNYEDFHKSIMNTLPDTNLGTSHAYTGSDILTILEKFIDDREVEVCGAQIVVYLRRLPNDTDASRLAEKLRKNNIYLYVSQSRFPSGGLSDHIMYNLTTETYGLCYFDLAAISTPPAPIYKYTKPFLHFADNRRTTGGQGKMKNFEVLYPNGENFTFVMTVQEFALNYAPWGNSFEFFTTSMKDPITGQIIEIHREFEGMGNATYFAENLFLSKGMYYPETKSEFTKENTLQIRMYHATPPDRFIPYDDDILTYLN